MRIGIDFDNTIVNYRGVFHSAALDLGWISGDVGASKQEVKQFFIQRDLEDRWTELQGVVYGKYIRLAKPYANLRQVLEGWRNAGHHLFVVSHKTRYPIIGDKLDFHRAASAWLEQEGLTSLFEQVYFCPEQTLKVQTIASLELDWFIDDLAKVLTHPAFPEHTHKCLFSENAIQPFEQGKQAANWYDIDKVVMSGL